MSRAIQRERNVDIIYQERPDRKYKAKIKGGYGDDLGLKHCRITTDFDFPFVPDPDYDQVEDMDDLNHNPRFDENGLILPRRAVMPHLDTRKDLNRELMFNNKTGKNVLNQKSELSKALEKHRVNQTRKEAEQERTSSCSEMERVLQERAKKIEETERTNQASQTCETSQVCNPEFLRIHAKLKNRIEAFN